MAGFLYEFEWDPLKARTNFSKHGIDFERAAEVFRDPLAITIPDEDHSEGETRWITMGGRDRSIRARSSYFRPTCPRPGARPVHFGTQADKFGNPQLRGKSMKPEYNFSKGERGKFFRPGSDLRLPIYLDSEVQTYLAEHAARKGMPLGEMVNGLLKREIRIIESVK